jgi:hypothetical protein
MLGTCEGKRKRKMAGSSKDGNCEIRGCQEFVI